jgi:EAL domain-containing protein (putative c-di-GMP-specific phosphodiesterase class I)
MQRRVIAVLAEWLNADLKPFPVSIDAAPAEFLCNDFAERLLASLGELDVSPELIELTG